MKLHQPNATIYIPDGSEISTALKRTTHLGIGAHQDDLEFMAFHGILECFHHVDGTWFTGVTCTNGAGSARTGAYAHYSDEEMQGIRIEEQNQAARIGRYAAMLQLDYPSKIIKDPTSNLLREDVISILEHTRPKVVYTHNLADKHDTHLSVVVPVIQAIRALPKEQRPKRVYGCEVWRDLDWMDDARKVALPVGGNDSLAAALNGVFDSQIAGGKRYDLAVMGRRRANATFFASHSVDQADMLTYAMDLTLLCDDPTRDLVDFVCGHIDDFKNDVAARVQKNLA